MGPAIFFLLFLVAVLLCTPRAERALALGSMAVVGTVIWLAIETNLHRILGSIVGDVVGLAWEYRNDLMLLLASAIVFIVPILMIYMAVCDQLDRYATAKSIRARRSLKALGLILRSEHPWLWVADEERSSRMIWRFRNKK